MALQIYTEKKSHPIRWAIVLLLIALVAGAGWFTIRWYVTGEQPPIPLPIASADDSVDETKVTSNQVKEHAVPAAHPRYIRVPSLGISNARINAVGVNEQNQLIAPSNIDDVAWYDQSGIPGSGGVVLLNGHNGGVTRDGVFAPLTKLKNGDELTVERGDGKTFTYAVQDTQTMSLAEVDEKGMKLMSESAKPGIEALNLITCDGNWVPAQKTFSHRLLVRSTLVE